MEGDLVFGFDGSRTAFDAIRKGDSRPRFFRIPSNKARRPSRPWWLTFREENPIRRVITPLRLITSSNVDKFQPAY